MRKRFEQQLRIGETPIGEIYINPKSKNPLEQLIAALKELYCNKEYIDKIFSIIEKHLPNVDRSNGRPGMNLWTVFVLGQVRLCLGIGYDMLHHFANNDLMLRKLMGISDIFGKEYFSFEYQNIYDNVNMLTDDMLKEINEVIVSFGQREAFKKKETEALRLKTDSFVVESNVHFPTDYNLLWDCIRKSLEMIDKLEEHRAGFPAGWRKRKSWSGDLKKLFRAVGYTSAGGGKQKAERMRECSGEYIAKSVLLAEKIEDFMGCFQAEDVTEWLIISDLKRYLTLMRKHIDLFERRVIKGEQIPHEEKMFSIFEPYTEWVNKGKQRPNVELGKKVAITTDQRDLIVDYRVMNHEQDRDIVMVLADRMLFALKYAIDSWSFDKGYWTVANRDYLRLKIKEVIMPKLGKLSGNELENEERPIFKRLRNKHSAIESNINELEHRGLNRCPDRGELHFDRYIGMGVCAYNLKKIGRAILKRRCQEALPHRKAAA